MSANEKKDNSSSDIIKFFAFLGQAKRTYRTGWVVRGVKHAESICDHMYRMSLMAFLAPSHLNRSKCIEMCLIHDMAECIVGDLTPEDKVSKEEKQNLENNAINTLTNLVSTRKPDVSDYMKQVYEEYSAHESPEANYVKSLDLFDMFLQAYEYELLNKIDLGEFLRKIPDLLASEKIDPQIKEWITELMKLREKKIDILPFDSNLNTILKNFVIEKQH